MSLIDDIRNALPSHDPIADAVHAVIREDDLVKDAANAVTAATANTSLDLYSPFAVANAPKHYLGGLEDSVATVRSPFTDIAQLFANNNADTGGVAGNSVTAILLGLAAKERQQLGDKVTQLKNLQVPPSGSSQADQTTYDNTKIQLMADIQSIQNSIQQIITMATNVEKTDNDTNMSIARNLA